MSGISQATAILTARDALEAATRVALADEHEVDIASGFRWPFIFDDFVALTSMTSDADPKVIGGRRQQEESLTFHMNIGSWRSGDDDDTEHRARARAFGLLAKIQEHIRTNDITLGGTVLWCLPGPVASDGATDPRDAGVGRYIEIDATFVCSHRVRTL